MESPCSTPVSTAHLGRRRGRREVHQLAHRRREAGVGILGVHARLDGVPRVGDLLLPQRQGLAGRDPELPLDQIEPGDLLGHRVLHLQTRVHLHEVEMSTRLDDELHRPGAHVVHRPGRQHGGGAHLRAHLGGQVRRRRLFQHLLVPPLHRAIALEEVHVVTVGVAEDLHFDVARALDVLFQEDLLVAEGAGRLALAGGEVGGELLRLVHPAHALAAAPGGRLDEHGEADALGFFLQERRILVVAVVAGRDRHVGLHHQRLGRRLRPHGADRCRARSDEDDAGRDARLREIGVLGEKAVPGMERFRAGALRRGEDDLDRQVRLARRRRPDADGLVGETDVPRVRVGVGIDRDGAHAHAARGLDDATGDLAAIGDEQLFEHAVHIRKMPKRVGGMGACSAAERDSPSTRRLCEGSRIPSSQRRALA